MNGEASTVLILDDDEAVRESFVDFFEDRGFAVHPAETAEQALEVVALKQPQGAVVDIRLPGMDGIAFLREVSRAYPALACVICTGSPEYNPPADVLALFQVFECVFQKPVIDLTAMEQALRKQIGRCKGLRG